MDPDLGRAHKAAIEEEEGSGQNLLMGHLRIVNITLQYIPGGKVLYIYGNSPLFATAIPR